MKAAPLALVPKVVPPEDVVYQLMLLPVEIAVNAEVALMQTVGGSALAEAGADGRFVTETAVVTVPVQPLTSTE